MPTSYLSLQKVGTEKFTFNTKDIRSHICVIRDVKIMILQAGSQNICICEREHVKLGVCPCPVTCEET